MEVSNSLDIKNGVYVNCESDIFITSEAVILAATHLFMKNQPDGSSRFSSRDQYVAKTIQNSSIATCLSDLLTTTGRGYREQNCSI